MCKIGFYIDLCKVQEIKAHNRIKQDDGKITIGMIFTRLRKDHVSLNIDSSVFKYSRLPKYCDFCKRSESLNVGKWFHISLIISWFVWTPNIYKCIIIKNSDCLVDN